MYRLKTSLFLFFILPVLATAQSPERGSLADGTPFRVDAQGNEIIDYVAQLEQSVDHLKDRAYALEMDLEASKLTIAKLKSGEFTCADETNARPVIAEKNLINTASSLRGGDFAAVENQVLELEEQLRMREGTIKTLQRQLLAFSSDVETPQVEPKQELAQNVAVIKDIEESTKNNEITALDAKIAQRKKELLLVERKIREVATSKRVSLSEDQMKQRVQRSLQEQKKKDQERRAAFASRRLKAFESARDSLTRDLKSLDPLVSERDRLFGEYHRLDTKGVKFELSSLETKRGNTIASLTQKIPGIASPSQLAFYKKEVTDIRAKLTEDIALIERLTHLNQ